MIVVLCNAPLRSFVGPLRYLVIPLQARRQEMKWGGGCKTVELSSTQSAFSTVSVCFILHFTNWGVPTHPMHPPPAYGPGLGLYKLIYQSNFSVHVAYGRNCHEGHAVCLKSQARTQKCSRSFDCMQCSPRYATRANRQTHRHADHNTSLRHVPAGAQ